MWSKMRPWLSTYVIYRATTVRKSFLLHGMTQEMSTNTVWFKTMLDLLTKGVFYHRPHVLSDETVGVLSTAEHHKRKGWMRFQRRHGNGAPPLSTAGCTADVTEANQTTRTWWCLCIPLRSERSQVQLSGPTTAWGCPCHPHFPHLHSGGKNLLIRLTWRALRWCAVKHWVNVNDRQVTKSKEYLTSVCTKDGRGRGWLQSTDELFLLILSMLIVLPDDLRTKDCKHICPKRSYRPLCNAFVATGQWPSNTQPSDTLPFNQYWQCSQNLNTMGSTGRLPTPCLLFDIGSVGRILPTLFCSCKVCVFQVSLPLVETRDDKTLTACKKHFHHWLLLPSDRTPSVPGSAQEPCPSLLSCVCHQWLAEKPRGHIVAHLSYHLNIALFYKA